MARMAHWMRTGWVVGVASTGTRKTQRRLTVASPSPGQGRSPRSRTAVLQPRTQLQPLWVAETRRVERLKMPGSKALHQPRQTWTWMAVKSRESECKWLRKASLLVAWRKCRRTSL